MVELLFHSNQIDPSVLTRPTIACMSLALGLAETHAKVCVCNGLAAVGKLAIISVPAVDVVNLKEKCTKNRGPILTVCCIIGVIATPVVVTDKKVIKLLPKSCTKLFNCLDNVATSSVAVSAKCLALLASPFAVLTLACKLVMVESNAAIATSIVFKFFADKAVPPSGPSFQLTLVYAIKLPL